MHDLAAPLSFITPTCASSLTPVLENPYVMIAIVIGGCMLIGGGIDALRKTAQSRHRERTRRELFAYVAEGSISAADATTLLAASNGKVDWNKKIAEMVEWGTINAKDAERLANAFCKGAEKAGDAFNRHAHNRPAQG